MSTTFFGCSKIAKKKGKKKKRKKKKRGKMGKKEKKKKRKKKDFQQQCLQFGRSSWGKLSIWHILNSKIFSLADF